MIDRPLEIPPRSGDVLLVPAGAALLDLARQNRARLDEERRPLAGVPLGEIRRRARADALALGRAYTADADLAASPGGDLLLLTGHQPVFAHPGIWAKYLLLDRLAARGGAGLAVVVDSDEMEEVGADVPTYAGGSLARRREVLQRPEPDEPYEGQPAPTAQAWAEFLARIDRHIATLPEEAIRRAWAGFRAGSPPPVASLTAFILALRRRYERPRHFLDVPISTLAETESFRAFFLHIAAEAESFRAIHNRRLEAYREQQHVRTEAQPFPNLEDGPRGIELPFWSVAEGRRRRVFLDPDARTLHGAGTDPVALPADPGDPVFAALRLRPRAMTLTAFLRLLVADLFIHGVSGGRYDRVTDAVCADFFQVAPPAYAVASATLHLPFRAAGNPEERERLQRLIQESRHNPERLLAEPTAEQQAVIAEKWRLIRRLKEGTLSRRARRALTQEIRALNERLSVPLAPRLAALEARLAALDDRGPGEAATYRGYPFFLYQREEVEALVTKMLAGGI